MAICGSGFEGKARGRPTPADGRPGGVIFAIVAVLLAAAAGPAADRALAADARPDQAILYLGRDLAGPSKAWSLAADRPFLAIPYTGDAFRPVSGSIELGADVGVVLFEQPFFSSTDETCEYRLGSADDPALWWQSDKVQFVPGPEAQGDAQGEPRGPVSANLRPQEIASLILYRRDLGPPPGALLLERQRYVNWDCPAPTKARGYKRLFVPVAAPPNREGCFSLDVALSYGEAGTVSLDFSAASELLLLLPGDLGPAYAGIDHRFTAGVYATKDCSGTPASVSHPQDEARRFDLKQFGLDRKARSLTLGYDRGAYDAMLVAAAEAAESSVEAPEAVEDEEPVEAEETVEVEEPVEVEETVAAPEIAESPETAEDEEATDASAAPVVAPTPVTGSETAADAEPDAAGEPAPEPAPEPVAEAAPEPAVPETAAPAAGVEELSPAGETAQGEAPEVEMLESETLESETLQSETLESGSREGAASGPETAQATAPEDETAGDETGGDETAGDEATGGDTTGFLVLPEDEPQADGDGQDDGQSGGQASGQTFKFPLLQGYRLNACLQEQQDCGEPAASEWCRARGFAGGATAFEIDENIGSLFPTLAFGDLQLCANFVCDGFKEITCVP